MCVCVYICVYMYMFLCVYRLGMCWEHVCLELKLLEEKYYILEIIRLNRYLYIYTFAYIYIHTHLHIYIHTYTSTHTSTYMQDRHLIPAEIPLFTPDVLIIESTFGTQTHDTVENREKRITRQQMYRCIDVFVLVCGYIYVYMCVSVFKQMCVY